MIPIPPLAHTHLNSEMAVLFGVVQSGACAPCVQAILFDEQPFKKEPIHSVQSSRAGWFATFFLEHGLVISGDQTVSTLVTYVLIVNTLTIFNIKIWDAGNFVKFFLKRREELSEAAKVCHCERSEAILILEEIIRRFRKWTQINSFLSV